MIQALKSHHKCNMMTCPLYNGGYRLVEVCDYSISENEKHKVLAAVLEGLREPATNGTHSTVASAIQLDRPHSNMMDNIEVIIRIFSLLVSGTNLATWLITGLKLVGPYSWTLRMDWL